LMHLGMQGKTTCTLVHLGNSRLWKECRHSLLPGSADWLGKVGYAYEWILNYWSLNFWIHYSQCAD
jgi:hypothetical protein